MTSLDACPLLTFLAVQNCELHITEARLQAVARLSHLAALKLKIHSLPFSPSSIKAMLEHLGSLRCAGTWGVSLLAMPLVPSHEALIPPPPSFHPRPLLTFSGCSP